MSLATSITSFPQLGFGFWLALICFAVPTVAQDADPAPIADPGAAMSRIVVSPDGRQLIRADSGREFRIWGVNYDHDEQHRLIEEYWIDEWDTVADDFREIRDLGANVVRVHLQLGAFMEAADRPNRESLNQLAKLLGLARELRLYLDLTGLGCYRKGAVPDWYQRLNEQERWKVQATFWSEVAKVGREFESVFCYDLMNEPIVAGREPAEQWLAGELGGFSFVQRIALDRNGREPTVIAQAWVETMTSAIRAHDDQHLVTVGVIPWVFVFGGGKPLFYDPGVARTLDFASIHVYPESGKVTAAVKAVDAYQIGKPIVIEEIFPLKSSREEVADFIEQTRGKVSGWISFYWGTRPDEYRESPEDAQPQERMRRAILSQWLTWFASQSDRYRRPIDP